MLRPHRAEQKQTAVAAYLKSKQLPLFAFAGYNIIRESEFMCARVAEPGTAPGTATISNLVMSSYFTRS